MSRWLVFTWISPWIFNEHEVHFINRHQPPFPGRSKLLLSFYSWINPYMRGGMQQAGLHPWLTLPTRSVPDGGALAGCRCGVSAARNARPHLRVPQRCPRGGAHPTHGATGTHHRQPAGTCHSVRAAGARSVRGSPHPWVLGGTGALCPPAPLLRPW